MTIETENNGSERTLKIKGKIDTITSKDLKAEIADLSGIITLVYDMENVSYISSAGIRIILESLRKINQVNGRVIVRHANEVVRSVLDMTGFSNILTLED